MAIPEEIQRQVLAEATSATPNYDVDYNDERFGKVESDKSQALTELEQTYGGMIGSVDKYYDKQIEVSKEWADKQAQIQKDNTDFAIEQIEQQKAQASKDYVKEQSGAYVDWQKQSNQYGVNAEKMASAGLTNTGYSESSQVSMYNTYQNRVATAREVYSRAVLNYDNAIKDAILQNNAALAEIAYNALQKQLELSLQGFQYKNQLILEQANKKTELDQMYYNRYQDVLQQINTENAMAEDIRQFNETQKFQAAQAELERKFKEEQNRIQREFEAQQAVLNRQHDIALENVRDENERRQLEIQHQNELAQLEKEQEYAIARMNQELANDKALLKYEYDLEGTKITGGGTTKLPTHYSVNQFAIPKDSGFTGTTYESAVAYMKSKGVPSSNASAAMTQSEWSRRRNSYSMTGQGSTEVKNYSSYQAYLSDYVRYTVETYGK